MNSNIDSNGLQGDISQLIFSFDFSNIAILDIISENVHVLE